MSYELPNFGIKSQKRFQLQSKKACWSEWAWNSLLGNDLFDTGYGFLKSQFSLNLVSDNQHLFSTSCSPLSMCRWPQFGKEHSQLACAHSLSPRISFHAACTAASSVSLRGWPAFAATFKSCQRFSIGFAQGEHSGQSGTVTSLSRNHHDVDQAEW